MEYSKVVGKLLKCSFNKTEEQVENLLGYLYYDEENVEELLPVEFEDMEELLNHSREIDFALDDGESPEKALEKVMSQIDFTRSRNIDKMIVKFIGNGDFDIDNVYESFSALEFGMNSRSETDVLIAASRDLNFQNRAIAIVLIASDGKF